MLLRHNKVYTASNKDWTHSNYWAASVAFVLLLLMTSSVVLLRVRDAVKNQAYVTCVIEDSKSASVAAEGVCFY